MALMMFDALLPYFGGKRKLCPEILQRITKFIPRERWPQSTFVDGFLGSGAVSLYAKSQGFRIIANDISERSVIAGKALIENNGCYLSDYDVYRLCLENKSEANGHFIEKNCVPDIFPRRHAFFLDNAFANARNALDKYLLVKCIFTLRPYSKFSSPNAFNRPFEDGRFEEIKNTYIKHIKDNLKSPLSILKAETSRINSGIFTNGHKNEIHKKDIFDFVAAAQGDVLYLDPPYSGTLAYESEYNVLDTILGDERKVSRFSADGGMEYLEEVFARAQHIPLWVLSFGNAGGKNTLDDLLAIIRKFRQCEAVVFAYRHCEAMASEEHKQQCREWLVTAWK